MRHTFAAHKLCGFKRVQRRPHVFLRPALLPQRINLLASKKVDLDPFAHRRRFPDRRIGMAAIPNCTAFTTTCERSLTPSFLYAAFR
jgi:hypothetical protein